MPGFVSAVVPDECRSPARRPTRHLVAHSSAGDGSRADRTSSRNRLVEHVPCRRPGRVRDRPARSPRNRGCRRCAALGRRRFAGIKSLWLITSRPRRRRQRSKPVPRSCLQSAWDVQQTRAFLQTPLAPNHPDRRSARRDPVRRTPGHRCPRLATTGSARAMSEAKVFACRQAVRCGRGRDVAVQPGLHRPRQRVAVRPGRPTPELAEDSGRGSASRTRPSRRLACAVPFRAPGGAAARSGNRAAADRTDPVDRVDGPPRIDMSDGLRAVLRQAHHR